MEVLIELLVLQHKNSQLQRTLEDVTATLKRRLSELEKAHEGMGATADLAHVAITCRSSCVHMTWCDFRNWRG